MKSMTEDLQDISIEKDGSGFTVWITETDNDGNKKKYWLIDGSTVKYTGRINVNNDKIKQHKHRVVFDRKTYNLRLVSS